MREEKLRYLIENPKISREMGRSSRKRAEKLFDHKRMAREYIKIYEKYEEL